MSLEDDPEKKKDIMRDIKQTMDSKLETDGVDSSSEEEDFKDTMSSITKSTIESIKVHRWLPGITEKWGDDHVSEEEQDKDDYGEDKEDCQEADQQGDHDCYDNHDGNDEDTARTSESETEEEEEEEEEALNNSTTSRHSHSSRNSRQADPIPSNNLSNKVTANPIPESQEFSPSSLNQLTNSSNYAENYSISATSHFTNYDNSTGMTSYEPSQFTADTQEFPFIPLSNDELRQRQSVTRITQPLVALNAAALQQRSCSSSSSSAKPLKQSAPKKTTKKVLTGDDDEATDVYSDLTKKRTRTKNPKY